MYTLVLLMIKINERWKSYLWKANLSLIHSTYKCSLLKVNQTYISNFITQKLKIIELFKCLVSLPMKFRVLKMCFHFIFLGKMAISDIMYQWTLAIIVCMCGLTLYVYVYFIRKCHCSYSSRKSQRLTSCLRRSEQLFWRC